METTVIELENMEPLCLRCGGSGYLRPDVPPSHESFGVLEPCDCTRRKAHTRRQAEIHDRSRLPRRLQLETFETWSEGDRHNDQIARHARAFALNPEGRTLFFCGPRGTGKTKLASAIVNSCLERGFAAAFFVVPDLLDHLRATYGPESEISYDELLDQVRTTDLLVLDDLRTAHASPWALEKLYQVLNHRYNDLLPTVITSNVHPNQIDEMIRGRIMAGELLEMREASR